MDRDTKGGGMSDIDLEKAVEFYKRHSWRKCSEEMPPDRVEVLGLVVSDPPGFIRNPIMQMFFDRGQWKTIDHWPGAKPIYPPTHWMPLPEAPE